MTITWTEEEFDKVSANSELEQKRLWADLKTESDRGVALAVGAFFESSLENALLAYFDFSAEAKLLLKTGSPLGTFNARRQFSYALKIISADDAKLMQIISKIRNQFAHNLLTEFSDNKLQDYTNNLITTFFAGELNNNLARHLSTQSGREKFIFIAELICGSIGNRWLEIMLFRMSNPLEIPYEIEETIYP